MVKKTKVLCTIGPSSLSYDVLKRMREAGMNGARINTVFGDFDQYREIIDNVRRIGDMPVLMDLNGPGLRTRIPEPIEFREGDLTEVCFGNPSFSFNYDIYDQVEVGDPVFVDDGRIRAEIAGKDGKTLRLLMKDSGTLKNGKGVNIPSRKLDIPTLSEKDLEVIEFAKQHEVEFMGLSFTRSRQDILHLKKRLGGEGVGVIAKIENHQGLDNFEEILEEANGIMIARGDLGVETEAERVPLVQKWMIRKCNQAGKIVVTATEMLDSMISSKTPTRAEVSDVANAILDGTDVVMLSGETSIGQYPVEAVAMMAKIGEKVENRVVSKVEYEGYKNISNVVSRSVQQIAESMPLDKVVTMTTSGYTARMIARFKLKQPIIAVTARRAVRNRLELVYGVLTVLFDYEKEVDRVLGTARELHSRGILREEDMVLFTAGFRTTQKHASNLIEIHVTKDLLQYNG